MPFLKPSVFFGWILIAELLAAGPVWARSELQDGLAGVAKDIKIFLDERGENALSIGQFSGPPTLPGSGGPGIALILSQEFKTLGVSIRARANVGIEGSFRHSAKAESQTATVVELTVRAVDDTGKSLLKQDRRLTIFDKNDIAILLGLTIHASGRSASEIDVTEAIRNPRVQIAGTRISASRASPYAVQFLVARSARGPFKVRKPRQRDGLAFIPIKKGEVYRVRVINKSRHDAAVTLHIDGIDMFAFSKIRKRGGTKFSRVIVGRSNTADLKGWHINNKVSDAFLVTEYARSAAAELKSTAPTGGITVTFARAWNKKIRLHRHSMPRSANKAKKKSTGRGQRIQSRYSVVRREVGPVRDTISVRYAR